MKILLVEDTIGVPVQAILHRWGHEVTLATTIAGARQHLISSHFEVFLFDWMLPDGSGLDLVRMMRQDVRFLDAPILMMSSRSDRRDIVHAVRSGIDGYLAKPFRPAELHVRLDEVWQRRIRRQSVRKKAESIVGGQTVLDRHGTTPLVILGEEATTAEQLEAPGSAMVLDYLATATTAIASANAILPGLELGYCLSGSTGDVTKLLRQRATADRVQLALISTRCYGNCVVMARLLHLRAPEAGRLCIVSQNWSDLSRAERAELDQLGVVVFTRDELDASRWRDIIEMQIVRTWSPELYERFVDNGTRDSSWTDVAQPH